jgi:hypothetical protein
VVLAAIRSQSASDQWRKDGGQYIPNPATWIRQRRWEDGLCGVELKSEGNPGDIITLPDGRHVTRAGLEMMRRFAS